MRLDELSLLCVPKEAPRRKQERGEKEGMKIKMR